ncbi:MAG: hypothetical protein MUF47_13165 [Porphyrobacter sp.]|jgi:hypothetical protein|nr:hypothetical protein [Porphyrobacter sp.]
MLRLARSRYVKWPWHFVKWMQAAITGHAGPRHAAAMDGLPARGRAESGHPR